MKDLTYYLPGNHAALTYAKQKLRQRGCNIADEPGATVTHLVLPVPSFEPDGRLKGGGDLQSLLSTLPDSITVIGGNLDHPALSSRKHFDLLQDPFYLAENAAITAHCAVKIALQHLPVTMDGCHVLVIGWGRIGKCLASLLKAMGANVTVAARKESELAILRALGYGAEQVQGLRYGLMRYRVIFNTVPSPVLARDQISHCRGDCLKIDLASVPGIAGEDVIWARGLPGKGAPEASGDLIARSVIRLSI